MKYLHISVSLLVSLWLLLCLQVGARDVIKAYHDGFFYPAIPQQLQTRLNDLFRQPLGLNLELPLPNDNKLILPALAIISPHDSFDVSGAVTAQVFKAVRAQKVKRVFILAPKHQVSFYGAVLPEARAFQTPLGDLQVDRNAISKLSHYPLFIRDDTLFACDDHAIELQLPFIRYTFGNVPIVPIMIGNLHGEREIELLAKILRQQLSAEDLLVVSADFTHYGAKYNFQPFNCDVMQNIKELDSRAYAYLANRDLRGFMDFRRRTRDPLCGYLPCCVLLAMLPESSTACLLAYDNSDNRLGTMSQKSISISYMGIAFSGPAWSVDHQQTLKLKEGK